VTPDDVLPLYRDGIGGVVAAVDGWDDERWAALACGQWSALDLAGHLLAVAGWYHDWLDRAQAGDSAPAFDIDDLAAQNDHALAALAPATGPERIAAFEESALRYADRLPACWDLPFGYPRGTVTAGQHAALACTEWHLHAWDLATSAGRDHRPDDPATLFVAAGETLLAVQGGAKAAVQRPLLPLAAKRDPWGQILTRSGRTPIR
jgi:hypothetical protein